MKGSEESVIVACLYSRACALLELPNAPVEFGRYKTSFTREH